jgi:hypothetical protein
MLVAAFFVVFIRWIEIYQIAQKSHTVMKKLSEESVPKWLAEEDPVALNKRLLFYCGLLPANTDAQKLRNMTISAIITILTLTMVAGAFIQSYYSHTNFLEIIECGTVCITQLKCLFKYGIMLIYQNDLRYVIDNIRRNFYVHENMFKKEILAKIKIGRRVAWWITVPYISVFVLTICLIAAERIVAATHYANSFSDAGNGTNVIEAFRRKLPLKIWLPINDKESPSYEIGFIYQIVCFTLEIYSACVIDTFLVVIAMFASIQYELLGTMIQLPADTVAMLLRARSPSSQQGKLEKLITFSSD